MAGIRGARRCAGSAVALVALLLPACGGEEVPRIDLEAREKVTYPQRRPAGNPVRFILGGAMLPTEGYHRYKEFLRLVETRLGRPVQALERPGFAAANTALARGEADAAFHCSGPYVAGHDEFGLELLAAPVVGGKSTYTAVFIVPAASGARRLEDLRGRSFAFVDALSFTGHLLPLSRVAALGGGAGGFFGRTVFTGSHDASVRTVAQGLVDGAAVDNLLLDHLRLTRPAEVAGVRVIEESGPYAGPPVVVRPGLDPALTARLREIFLGLDGDEAGRAVLRRIGVERFVACRDADYDPIRRVRDGLRGVVLPPAGGAR